MGLIEIAAAVNLVLGMLCMFALMGGRMKRLPTFHRIPVAVISASLLLQAAFELGGYDRSVYPLWILRDAAIWYLAVLTIYASRS